MLVAGGGFVAGSASEMGAVAVLEAPWRVHLHGGTHWAHWANALTAALPRLDALSAEL